MASKVTFNGELLFPNDYLNAAEFKGRDVKLTIVAISREMLQKKGGKDKKETVFRFERTAKKFVCNKTNADTIASMYGTKAETWVGKTITLYPTRCLAFGEMVDCIRIREKPVAKPTAPPQEFQGEPDAFGEDSAPVATAPGSGKENDGATDRSGADPDPAAAADENQAQDAPSEAEQQAIREQEALAADWPTAMRYIVLTQPGEEREDIGQRLMAWTRLNIKPNKSPTFAQRVALLAAVRGNKLLANGTIQA